ncbi:MAG: FtsX-like permease family protein [Chloroflexi bacterium]|jgi:putative ABC transport system permease protein|nr:FtsX-like permease family protein [Chloroflexota bacterium]
MKASFLRPSWRKVLADLWVSRTRTLLVVASIAVGVFAVGTIASMYVIVAEDIRVGYAAAQPANIEIITDPFDDNMVKTVQNIDGVSAAEGRQMVPVRVSLDGKTWKPLDVMANEDFTNSTINLIDLVDGTAEPGDRELIVRRDRMNSSGLSAGDQALMQLPNGTLRTVPVVGEVSDQYAAGDFTAPPRGYMTLNSAEWIGGQDNYNRLYVQVEGDGNNEAAIADVAERVEDKLERTGRTIYRTNTNKTTEHPAESIALAMIGVLGALGVLVMLLSSSLIVNTLNALLTQHRRQIGVMKLVGARSFQISVMYIALIVFYGIIALIIAVPLGVMAGYGLAVFMGDFMSVAIQDFRVIPVAIILQVVLAMAIPLAAGYFPVNKGSKTTVRRAISEDGPGESSSGSGLLDRMGTRMRWLSRPLLLSIRNTFRRKGRLALTLFTLIVAGSIFIAVFNVRSSLNGFMDKLGQHFMADVMVTLEQPYRIPKVEQLAFQVPGIQKVEGWSGTVFELLDEDDKMVSNLLISAPPAGTTFVNPDMIAGRWLEPGDEKVLVVSDTIYNQYPDLQPGDTLRVSIQDGRAEEWPVIGVFPFVDMLGDSLGYANYDTIATELNAPGVAATFRMEADATNMEEQQAISTAIDDQLRAAGIKVSNVEAGLVTRQQQSQGMNILVIFLLIMALLTAVVGSIGLMGTMGMNVLERTREIGVMRAIGAVDGEIMKSVVVEGMMIGLISWAVAVILSFPISFFLLRIISTAMIDTEMSLKITGIGFIIWLGVVVLLSVVASMVPARSAARLTIREVLAYE